MMLGAAGIIVAYVLIAILLLSINLYSNWSWRIKAATTVVTSIFYIICYLSFPPLLGWPTAQVIPSHFRLLASEVRQPDKTSGEQGIIYLWLDTVENDTSYHPPRAYKLPYSKPLHNSVIIAQSKINRGISQLGEYKANMEPAVIHSPKTGKESLDIQFYDMPELLFPDK